LQKKILIISRAFAPLNAIGSIRPTKIGKYLKINHGCHITVLTTVKKDIVVDQCLARDMKYFDDIIEVKTKSWIKSFVKKIRGYRTIDNKNYVKNNILSSHDQVEEKKRHVVMLNIKKYIGYITKFFESRSFYRNALIVLKNININNFDVIFSTYSPFASHQIAEYIKNKNPNIKWIADFRDPVLRDFDTLFGFGKYCRDFTKRVSRNADAVTAVSQGVLDELYIMNYKNKHVIPNGFDIEDIEDIAINKHTEGLTFAYVGNLYNGKRDLSVIFKAIKELIDEGIIDPFKIHIIYAGQSKSTFLLQVNKFDLAECTTSFDFIEREKSLNIQLESSILLLASWNTSNSSGVVTGKFLEYMMMGKPILCTISGEKPNSLLKKMINEANIGFCYEESNDENDYYMLKDYILNQYNRFIGNKELVFEPNEGYIDKFNYKNIADQFYELF